MTRGSRHAAAMTAALFVCVTAAACAPATASAGPVETTFAATINAISGDHEVSGGEKARTSFAPLPLGELTFRHGHDSLRIEALPAVTLPVFQGSRVGLPDGSLQSVKLAIVNATYRRAFAGGWFVGAGETVYNQASDFGEVRSFEYLSPGQFISADDASLEQRSRVVGARFEAGRSVAVGRDRFEAWVAANPSMHGLQYTRVNGYAGAFTCFSNGCTPDAISLTAADSETAAQVDASARIAHRVGKHGELLYGVRYINYTARYGNSGEFADRNVGIAPVLGYRVRL
jgi:hypothetical protein